LISYVKKNKWFHSPKTCLSHGKTISPFRFMYTFSVTIARPLTDFRFLLFLLNKRNALEKSRKTSLSPSLFIEVPELSQEGSFICVLGISNLHISTIFLLNVGIIPTVWYIFFSFYCRLWKKTAELQLLKKIWLWSSSVIKIVKI
jgi:hypothetical protein